MMRPVSGGGGLLRRAEAFGAALAKKRKAEFNAGDPEFEALEKELKINWLARQLRLAGRDPRHLSVGLRCPAALKFRPPPAVKETTGTVC